VTRQDRTARWREIAAAIDRHVAAALRFRPEMRHVVTTGLVVGEPDDSFAVGLIDPPSCTSVVAGFVVTWEEAASLDANALADGVRRMVMETIAALDASRAGDRKFGENTVLELCPVLDEASSIPEAAWGRLGPILDGGEPT